MTRIIKTNGNEVITSPKNGSNFSLGEMQKIVGGWIEVVTLRNGQLMVVNEEGKMIGLPYNQAASILCGQPVVGDVLVCDSEQIK